MRQDGADGDVAPDARESGTDGPAGADGSDRERQRPGHDGEVPDVDTDRAEQDDAEAARQEENAETSLDQPSS